MRFENSKGEFLELNILGYQFPHNSDDKWDSNWLNIKFSVAHKDGVWTATDPCFLTWEIENLCKWFENIRADYKAAKPTQEFMEPNLTFMLVNIAKDPALRIYFELELRPARNPPKTMKKPMEDLWVEFPLKEIDLHEAVNSLRCQLSKYPERAVEQP
jgi:hypothetical protein